MPSPPLGLPQLPRMSFEVSHYFEKEVMLGSFFDYINKEAIDKDRMVTAGKMRAMLR